MNSHSKNGSVPTVLASMLVLMIFFMAITALFVRYFVSGNWSDLPVIIGGFSIIAAGWVLNVFMLRRKNPRFVVNMLAINHPDDEY